MRLTYFGAGFVLWAALLGRVAEAQQTDSRDYRAPGITRQQLEGVLARYEAAAQSPAYSEGLRARARADADSVRARLQGGDLRVGDRLRISVEGQPQLADTAAVVTEGPALVMPGIGSVPLGGVLRSEDGLGWTPAQTGALLAPGSGWTSSHVYACDCRFREKDGLWYLYFNARDGWRVSEGRERIGRIVGRS